MTSVKLFQYRYIYKVENLVGIWLQEIQNDFDQVTDRDIASLRSGKNSGIRLKYHTFLVFEDEPEPGDATAEAVLNRNEKIKNEWSPYEDQKRLMLKVQNFWSILKKKLISDPAARDRARRDFRRYFSRNRRSKIFTSLLKEVYDDMVNVLKVYFSNQVHCSQCLDNIKFRSSPNVFLGTRKKRIEP